MINIDSNVYAIVHDKDGRLLRVVRAKNLVVNDGLTLIGDLLGGINFRPDAIQVGTGTSSTTATMTALESSVHTKIIERRIRSGFSLEFQALLLTSEANGNTLSEIGTFKGSTMVARALISPAISKTNLIQVTLGHVFTVAAS